ncbi:unnamed protein product [Rotaria sp. Silwood2]|nr:unnamed protein product [Rotaria sp. Silwood2]
MRQSHPKDNYCADEQQDHIKSIEEFHNLSKILNGESEYETCSSTIQSSSDDQSYDDDIDIKSSYSSIN